VGYLIIDARKNMATIAKPSKSMSFQNETSSDIEKAKSAIANGAKVVECPKGGFAIEYPSGGYFKITNTVYKAITA